LNIYNKLQERRAEIIAIAAKHGVYNVRVFRLRSQTLGRLSRRPRPTCEDGALKEPSDLGGLLMDLQELLGCPIDVVTEKGLRGGIRERVLKEAMAL
jgi:hypothetical protein